VRLPSGASAAYPAIMPASSGRARRLTFYSHGLLPEEQQLVARAAGSLELQDEIALLRARAARLAQVTSASPLAPENAQLVKILQLLTRMVGVQSRFAGADTQLAALNETVRRRLMLVPDDVAPTEPKQP
jgi:hypothetical protein